NFKFAIRPAQALARAVDFFFAQRRAVAGGGAGLGGGAISNLRAARDERRLVAGLGVTNSPGEGLRVVPVNRLHMPAASLKASQMVFGGGQAGGAVNADM